VRAIQLRREELHRATVEHRANNVWSSVRSAGPAGTRGAQGGPEGYAPQDWLLPRSQGPCEQRVSLCVSSRGSQPELVRMTTSAIEAFSLQLLLRLEACPYPRRRSDPTTQHQEDSVRSGEMTVRQDHLAQRVRPEDVRGRRDEPSVGQHARRQALEEHRLLVNRDVEGWMTGVRYARERATARRRADV